MPRIIFKSKDKEVTVDVEKGISILDAALRFGVPLYHTCGGNASCSTCRVQVLDGSEYLSGIEPPEAQVLDAFDLKFPHRLGCQAQLLGGDVSLRIPERSKEPRPNKTPPVPE